MFFVAGKGGVGRTSVALSLGMRFARQGERVLIVQWHLADMLSPVFGFPSAGHKESLLPIAGLPPGACVATMNFQLDQAIREYFVDHLKMNMIYSFVIQNKHVQKLVNGVPGIGELFFLGRLFWLVELAQKERGISYDRIVVDCPATGHGMSLFTLTKAVARFGLAGPLATECDRVSVLLADKSKTAVLFVTLPEELPAEECQEAVPQIAEKLGYPPLCIFVNQSVHPRIYPQLHPLVGPAGGPPLRSELMPVWEKLSSAQVQNDFKNVFYGLSKRQDYENQLKQFGDQHGVPILPVPDFRLQKRNLNVQEVFYLMSEFFAAEKSFL